MPVVVVVVVGEDLINQDSLYFQSCELPWAMAHILWEGYACVFWFGGGDANIVRAFQGGSIMVCLLDPKLPPIMSHAPNTQIARGILIQACNELNF